MDAGAQTKETMAGEYNASGIKAPEGPEGIRKRFDAVADLAGLSRKMRKKGDLLTGGENVCH